MAFRYHRDRAVAYARKWAMSTNPTYPPFDNDCTSFVSQAIHEGGIPMAGARDYSLRWSADIWWYEPGGVSGWLGARSIRASYTWSGADMFAKRLRKAALAIEEAGPDKLIPGDLVQLSDGKQMRHSMIVTGVSGDGANRDLLLSYHSRNTLDKPLKDILDGSSRTPVYWRMK